MPVDLIPVPSGLLSRLLLIQLRGQEPGQKQAVIGHRGRWQEYIPLLWHVLYPEPCRQFCVSGHSDFIFTPTRAMSPPRIHVRTPDGECKFWLEPSILLAGNRGVKPHDLRQIERLIFENQEILKQAYYDIHPR